MTNLLSAMAALTCVPPRVECKDEGIQPMINLVDSSPHPYVVVMLCEDGIRLKPESKAACELMAEILGDTAKALPREEFLSGMRKLLLNEEPK